jgi:hypothetical protein
MVDRLPCVVVHPRRQAGAVGVYRNHCTHALVNDRAAGVSTLSRKKEGMGSTLDNNEQ